MHESATNLAMQGIEAADSPQGDSRFLPVTKRHKRRRLLPVNKAALADFKSATLKNGMKSKWNHTFAVCRERVCSFHSMFWA